MCNPEVGFRIADNENKFRWQMYTFWKQGISPREFRKTFQKDIIDCIDIENAINEKQLRQKKLNQLLSKVRY